MTFAIRQGLLTLVAGSALAIAPFAFATFVGPAVSNADEGRGLNCPDGTIVDEENRQCVDLVQGISKQLQALPPPPALSGGFGGLGGLPGGFPSLGTINAPDLVLPGVGLGLVPNINLQPQIGLPSAPQMPSINPLNPLGLPPPPDLTPGIPFI